MKSAISEKGQIVIPKRLRDRLGYRPGQELAFEEVEGRLVVTKVRAEDPVDRVYGILKSKHSSDELVDELRGPATRK